MTFAEITKIVLPVKKAVLHSSLSIGGKDETTIYKAKVPKITEMGWAADGFFIFKTETEVHRIPSTAFRDTLLISE